MAWEEESTPQAGEDLCGRGPKWSWVQVTCESCVSELGMLVFYGPDSGYLGLQEAV